MASTLPLSSTSARPSSLRHTSTLLSAVSPPRHVHLRASTKPAAASIRCKPMRVWISGSDMSLMKKTKQSSSSSSSSNTRRRRMSAVCYVTPLTVDVIQWIATISTAALLFAKGTAVQKSFLVPMFVLQAPGSFITWIKGEYGLWSAFLALLVRLFLYIPGELELPLVAFLLVIVAPYQVMNIRGRQEGAILSLVIAGYMAFQHFSRIGSLKQSFDQGSIIATIAIVSITVLSCLLLF